VLNTTLERNDLLRLLALGVLVILEGLAVVSTVLNLTFLPLGTIYPNIDSVTILVLPVILGAVSQRLEVAIVLTVLPFFLLAVVYTTVYAPVWNIDLFQLGVLAERVAGGAFLLGGLGAFGWLLRRTFNRTTQKG
jgi:amino acid permease